MFIISILLTALALWLKLALHVSQQSSDDNKASSDFNKIFMSLFYSTNFYIDTIFLSKKKIIMIIFLNIFSLFSSTWNVCDSLIWVILWLFLVFKFMNISLFWNAFWSGLVFWFSPKWPPKIIRVPVVITSFMTAGGPEGAEPTTNRR